MYTVTLKLQKEFIGRGEVRGFKFSQCIANSKAFIYRVENYGHSWYEVFLRKIDIRFGSESYPKAKSFGKWAWTYHNESKAIKKFEEISNGQ